MNAPLLTLAATIALAAALAACGDEELIPSQSATSSGLPSASLVTLAPTETPSAPPVTPSATVAVSASPVVGEADYVDPSFGYSFTLPDGWFALGGMDGYTAVSTFNPITAPPLGGGFADDLKADMYVYANDSALVLEDWIAQNTSGAVVEDVRDSSIGGQRAVIRRVTLPDFGNQTAVQYFSDFGSRIYVFVAYSSDESLLAQFQSLVDGFSFGEGGS